MVQAHEGLFLVYMISLGAWIGWCQSLLPCGCTRTLQYWLGDFHGHPKSYLHSNQASQKGKRSIKDHNMMRKLERKFSKQISIGIRHFSLKIQSMFLRAYIVVAIKEQIRVIVGFLILAGHQTHQWGGFKKPRYKCSNPSFQSAGLAGTWTSWKSPQERLRDSQPRLGITNSR